MQGKAKPKVKNRIYSQSNYILSPISLSLHALPEYEKEGDIWCIGERGYIQTFLTAGGKPLKP